MLAIIGHHGNENQSNSELYHLKPMEWLTSKRERERERNAGEDVKKKEPFVHC